MPALILPAGVFDLGRAIDLAFGVAALAAAITLVLLIPLYLSQRRDIGRLRRWMEADPEHPAADLEASEEILDRAETELEVLLARRGTDALDTRLPVASEPAPGISPAAARVTSERPALERITLEREALEPHPRWRRFAARVTRPWALALIGVLAMAGGAAAIYSTVNLPIGGDGEAGEQPFDRSQVSVSVLNGTSVSGLAGTVQTEVSANGYRVERVGGTGSGYERTLVMFRAGERPAALHLARDLDVPTRDVERLHPEVDRLAGDADVVVIAGEDRA